MRQMREHRVDGGALVFGAILLLVGGYFLLRNTFGIEIPDLDWDMIWPFAIIGLGIVVLIRAMNRRTPG
jgi:TRAP-type C4-dicarboxylate transport system permease small subunit